MHMQAVILAAGKGTRMKSEKPKVLHELCGKSMLSYVIDNVRQAKIDEIAVVVGYKADEVKSALVGDIAAFVQHEQLGTGHAVMQAASFIDDDAYVVVLYGDAPLVNARVIEEVFEFAYAGKKDAVVLSTVLENPYGYGRIIRDENGKIKKIVEQKDADSAQQAVKEINSGVYCFLGSALKKALKELRPQNAAKEYYLTDSIEELLAGGYDVDVLIEQDSDIIKAVNDKKQLAQLEKMMRQMINNQWLSQGVTMMDPENTYISYDAVIAPDVLLYPNVVIEGRSIIKKGTVITSNSLIRNSIIGEHCMIQSSVITDSTVGNHAKIGPFAHLRPKSILGEHVKIGNFVEVKASTMGDHSKSSHLTYIGDAKVGENVNLGCGVVFVNYDGKAKNVTVVEDDCFVGCNVNLIAPVTIKKGAYIAAGSTITEDVEEYSLAIARSRQTNKENWVMRPGEASEEEKEKE